ncbi:carbohydrate kinase [Mycoplasmopsis agassizii]|uniref:carbohydrate kinase family protein n=1 Tax=Mycoplasmopsis agassizii TaxID=33922 RepID=UPI003527B64A
MIKIFLPGEALIDQIRKSDREINSIGGATFNVAHALSRYDYLETYFIGAIGNDKYGKLISDFADKNNIKKTYLKTSTKPTTIAIKTLADNGERSFLFERGADEDLGFVDENFDVLFLSSATSVATEKSAKVYKQYLDKASEQKKIIIYDPNYRAFLFNDDAEKFKEIALPYLNKAHIIKLSEEEANILSKKHEFKNLAFENSVLIFITLGKDGCMIVDKDNGVHLIESIKIDQVDTTGAGDAFIANVTAQLLKKYPNLDKLKKIKVDSIKEIVKKANIAAAITTTRDGAAEAMPELNEIEDTYTKTQGN